MTSYDHDEAIQKQQYEEYYSDFYPQPRNEVKKLILSLYEDKKHFVDIAAMMHKYFEKIKNKDDLLEIIKSCIREYASILLQSMTPNNFEKAQDLWELHYRIEASSLKTQSLYTLYFQFYQTQQENRYDFNQLHFQIVRDQKDLGNTRQIHKQFKKELVKKKPALVQVLNDTSILPMQQLIETKSKQQPKSTKKEKIQTNQVNIVKNEFKEFEDRLSKLETIQTKLSPTFSQQWKEKNETLSY